jgi:hypothetical protein
VDVALYLSILRALMPEKGVTALAAVVTFEEAQGAILQLFHRPHDVSSCMAAVVNLHQTTTVIGFYNAFTQLVMDARDVDARLLPPVEQMVFFRSGLEPRLLNFVPAVDSPECHPAVSLCCCCASRRECCFCGE